MENNLPRELVEKMTSYLGKEMSQNNFHLHREKVWQRIIDQFYKENKTEVFVKGTVVKIKDIGPVGRNFEIKDAQGQTITIYCQNIRIMKNTVTIGSTIGVKGYYNLYKNDYRHDGELQIKANEITNLEETRWDIQPFKEFIDENRKRHKIRFFAKNKNKLALITSENSEAREDIKKVLCKHYKIEEHFVNLFDVDSISKKIEALDESDCDIILISRGGMDRLSVFNAYSILNAIYKSSKPLVTALGHASFSSLADIVADYSYNSPSAAAYELNGLRKKYSKIRNSIILTLLVCLIGIWLIRQR
ncbi:exodeoxyribonuclease VII large subunit [Fusibacter ferrireducens]|uniref:Exonuclease VII large subunit C-terminal domain-containing protein n=1 Tax=Fusibacter ferrireducens TaxID=2785058 RepID=A0ABR9ZUV9_9FIRM|nr:exodeoxyribonuclease VII large subunit [Fusibacter ferrireducens]MBF4694252.1 hypothetical protein [Fusibacter ferrireducens]